MKKDKPVGEDPSEITRDVERQKVEDKVVVKEEPKTSQADERVFQAVEQQPEYPGGQTALFRFLSENITYPKDAAEAYIQGRVVVSFVVEKDGSIDDVKVVRGVHPSLDAEAMRVIKLMPRWTPGRMNGSVVRVQYTLPLSFKLQAN